MTDDPQARRRPGLKQLIQNRSLSTKFILAATLVLCIAMVMLGSWVNRQITRSVLITTGAAAASFMESFMAPVVQDLQPDGTLSREGRDRLDALLVGATNRRSLVSVKVWRADGTDGTVIYSSETPDLVGQTFVSSDVAYAASGKIKAEFADMVSAESAYEQSLGLSLIEVYAPLFDNDTGEVVAVGEIYENGDTLARQLESSRTRTWGFVFVTTLLMLSVLYLIVRRGSLTIERQRSELQRRMYDFQKIASQNDILRKRAEKARMDANEANEELIGRVGQELHDGPIQVMSLVMLRIGNLSEKTSQSGEGKEDVAAIRDLTKATIEELRTLSTGLVLPEIGDLPAPEVVRLAVERHENLTGTNVELVLEHSLVPMSAAIKICLYRVAQESLSNAMRHAGGVGQRVEMSIVENVIHLQISDRGRKILEPDRRKGTGLGLRGLRNRVETFGGEFEFRSTDAGTKVAVRIPLYPTSSVATDDPLAPTRSP